MGDYGRQDSSDGYGQDILSKVIRAGKRTYFFDVKSTRSKDMYLVITESKRRFEDDGNPSFEKHKIFLYREDLQKFTDALHEVAEYIAGHSGELPPHKETDLGDGAYGKNE